MNPLATLTHRLILCVVVLLVSSVRTTAAQDEPIFRGKPIERWIESLADEDVRVRWYAAYALGQKGPEAAKAIEPLTQMAINRGEFEYIRACAAWALGRIGPEANAAVVPLITVLDQSELLAVRRNAVWAIGQIGPTSEPAVPKLESLLEDPDPTTRVRTAAALWKITRHDRAIPSLFAALSGDDPSGAYEAAVLLGHLETDSEPVEALAESLAESLVEALSSVDSDVARAAARSIGQIGGPSAIPALARSLKSPDGTTRRMSVEALGFLGVESVALLTEALKDPAASVRRTAARSLGHLGPEAKQAESSLIEAVSDPDGRVRQTAAEALRRIRK